MSIIAVDTKSSSSSSRATGMPRAARQIAATWGHDSHRSHSPTSIDGIRCSTSSRTEQRASVGTGDAAHVLEPHLQGHPAKPVVQSVGMAKVDQQRRGLTHHPVPAIKQPRHLPQATTDVITWGRVHRHRRADGRGQV